MLEIINILQKGSFCNAKILQPIKFTSCLKYVSNSAYVGTLDKFMMRVLSEKLIFVHNFVICNLWQISDGEFCVLFQMRAGCRTSVTSKVCRKSRSAPWRSTAAPSTQTSRRASASCCCGCRRCAPSARKWSSNSSSCGWWARRRSRRWSGTCCSAAAPFPGPTWAPCDTRCGARSRARPRRPRPSIPPPPPGASPPTFSRNPHTHDTRYFCTGCSVAAPSETGHHPRFIPPPPHPRHQFFVSVFRWAVLMRFSCRRIRGGCLRGVRWAPSISFLLKRHVFSHFRGPGRWILRVIAAREDFFHRTGRRRIFCCLYKFYNCERQFFCNFYIRPHTKRKSTPFDLKMFVFYVKRLYKLGGRFCNLKVYICQTKEWSCMRGTDTSTNEKLVLQFI